MNRLMKPARLLPLLLLLMDSFGQSKDIAIPWNSTLLQAKRTFTVILGDEIHFDPCGDSPYTNLVYTNSKKVYDECLPENNITETVWYNFIGDCINPSGELRLLVKTGIPGVNLVAFAINETFYFLSNYMSECKNGLKAIVQVAETRPVDPEPTGDTTVPGGGPASMNVSPTPPVGGSGEPFLSSLEQLMIIAACVLAVFVIFVVFAIVMIACCYVRKRSQSKDLEMLEKRDLGTPVGYVGSVSNGSTVYAASPTHISNTYMYSPLTSSTFVAPNHTLSVETDGADSKTNLKEVSPPMPPLSVPAKPAVSKPAVPSKPSMKPHPREPYSLPAEPSLAKPVHNRGDASDPPVSKHPSNDAKVAQSLPATSDCKKPIIPPRREDGVRSPTRIAPKPPPKLQAANGFASKRAPPPYFPT